MINSLLRTILQEYSNIRGLGHPMTTEQQLNAFANWLTKTLPECIDVIAKLGSETKATLAGNGTPNNHYILTITLNKNDLVVSGEFQSKNITSTQININDIVKTETSYKLQGTQTFSYDDGTSNQAPYSTEIAIDSGEGIVLDITEDNDGLEIHLDTEVISKLSRCLLLPISAPTERSFVVIEPNNEQALIPVSQVGGGLSTYFVSVMPYSSAVFTGYIPPAYDMLNIVVVENNNYIFSVDTHTINSGGSALITIDGGDRFGGTITVGSDVNVSVTNATFIKFSLYQGSTPDYFALITDGTITFIQ